MKAEALVNRLRQLLDEHRGSTSPEQAYDCISLVALAAHQDPETVRSINNMGTVFQLPAMQSLCADLTESFPKGVMEFPDNLDPDFLIEAMQLVVEVDNHQELAGALRQNLASFPLSNSSIANYNEIELVSAVAANTTDVVLFDGAAGLAGVAAHLDNSRLILQESDTRTWKISYRLLLLSERDFSFTLGNSLLAPQVTPGSCDLAVMTPPFGQRLPSSEIDDLQAAPYVIPLRVEKIPTSASDSLWIQLALYSLNKTGRALLILPPGWLFRGGYDGKLRDYLLEHEFIEAVIGLPKHFLDQTAIEPVMLILAKSREQGAPVHFVDARNIGVSRNRSHAITTKDAQLIVNLAQGKYPDDPRYRTVHIPEIRKSDNVLSIQEYIQPKQDLPLPALNPAMDELTAAQKEHEAAQIVLTDLMSKARKRYLDEEKTQL